MVTPRRPGQRAGVISSGREIAPPTAINPNPPGAFSRTRKPGFPSRRAPSRLVALRLPASGHLPGNPSRMTAHGSLYHPRFATPTKIHNQRIPMCIVLVRGDVMKRSLKKHRSIAHVCGLARSITHVCLWIDTFFHPHPIRSITHTLVFQSQHWRGL